MLNNDTTVNDSFDVVEFVRTHAADDIVYALKNPAYYKMDTQAMLDLHTFVFKAINKELDSLR